MVDYSAAANDASATNQALQIAQKHTQAARGNRLVKSIGPGNLLPKAGMACIRAGKPLYCGSITGRIIGVRQHPNTKNPEKLSTAFLGQFLVMKADGTQVRPMELYLPSVVENTFMAIAQKSEEVMFAIEVWCEPDEKTPIGYKYTVHDVRPPEVADPLLELAYETGMLERPAPTLTDEARKLAQIGHDDAEEGDETEVVDPNTGEVYSAATMASAVKQARKRA